MSQGMNLSPKTHFWYRSSGLTGLFHKMLIDIKYVELH